MGGDCVSNSIVIDGKTYFTGYKRNLEKLQSDKYKLKMAATKKKKLPPLVDHRRPSIDVFDQESIQSCSASAVCKHVEYHIKKYPVSRLFQYYNTRKISKDQHIDNGADLEDSMKAIIRFGHIPEKEYPYIEEKVCTKPPKSAYRLADLNKPAFVRPQCVNQSLHNLKKHIYAGYTINFGAFLYNTFSAKMESGYMVPMPTSKDRKICAHAMLIVGYDDSKLAFIIQNSWGNEWGDNGYHYMPYDYITNPDLCFDFWILEPSTDNEKRTEKRRRLSIDNE